MRCFTIEDIGETRALTPQGYLVCVGAVIARTGTLYYRAGEIIPGPGEEQPVPGPDGIITVTRDEDELFDDDTLASFEGQPVTLGHPKDRNGTSVWVSPENWRDFTMGFTRNVRRGEGANSDCMVADLFITDPDLIDKIDRREIRELSNGYDCNYPSAGAPGRYKQTRIRGNHTAFVPRGRNGSRCAVGDEMHPLLERPEMATPTVKPAAQARRPMIVQSGTRRSAMDRFRQSFRTAMRTKDEDESAGTMEDVIDNLTDVIEEAVANATDNLNVEPAAEEPTVDEAEGGEASGMQAQLDELKAMVQALCDRMPAPVTDEESSDDAEGDDTGSEDDDAGPSKTTDAASIQDVVSRAEILSPGIRVPTVDSKGGAKKVTATLHSLRATALDGAYKTEAGRKAIAPFLGKRPAKFSAMTVDTAEMIFIGASEIMKGANKIQRPMTQPAAEGAPSPATMNQAAQAFWAKK